MFLSRTPTLFSNFFQSCLKISRRKHDKAAAAHGEIECDARLAVRESRGIGSLARHRHWVPYLSNPTFARCIQNDIALPLADDEEPVCISFAAVGRSELRLVVLAVTTPPVVVGRDVDEFSIVDVFAALQ